MPSAYGSGVPYRRRAVSYRCERYLVGARWGVRSDCGLPRSVSPEQTRKPKRLSTTPFVRLLDGDTECPLQVCQLSRSTESTHFLSLRREVAYFDSTRAPDGF